MDREEMIEKAAKAIDLSAWHGGVAHDPRWDGEAESRRITARRQAGAAFAVFEEAHAPTDDERTPEFESLEQELFKHQPVLTMTDGSIAGCLCMDRVFYKRTEDWGTHLAEVFEGLGFRRPASPERVDDLIDTRAGLALANAAWQEGASTMLRSVDEHDGGKPWSKPVSPYSAPLLARIKADAGMPEPEGEPIDAPTVQFVARRGGKSQALIDSMLAQANERGIRVEVVYPQTEPTDAAVKAALDAWYASGHYRAEEAMRAALRAAAEVKGEAHAEG